MHELGFIKGELRGLVSKQRFYFDVGQGSDVAKALTIRSDKFVLILQLCRFARQLEFFERCFDLLSIRFCFEQNSVVFLHSGLVQRQDVVMFFAGAPENVLLGLGRRVACGQGVVE
ncbi:hypothetical protein D3C81_1553190 [compost metagenome]